MLVCVAEDIAERERAEANEAKEIAIRERAEADAAKEVYISAELARHAYGAEPNASAVSNDVFV